MNGGRGRRASEGLVRSAGFRPERLQDDLGNYSGGRGGRALIAAPTWAGCRRKSCPTVGWIPFLMILVGFGD